jgi:uncharacterized protein YciI
MFIAILSYIRPLDEVDALIPAHLRYLDEHYASGLFVASGRRVPRTGGVILIAGEDRERVSTVLEQDPFQRQGIASYELIEFCPNKMQPGFEAYTQQRSRQPSGSAE